MAQRPVRTPQQLSDASVHVHYEWYMLVATAANMTFAPSPQWPYSIHCALINDLAVHARALRHFLWPEKPVFESDVIAEDYFPAGAWSPSAPPAMLDSLREDVAKYIVHISYDRPNAGGEKPWPMSVIALELDGHMRKFKEDVERRDAALLNDDHWRQDWRVQGREVAALRMHMAHRIARGE
jgi:hypothetical protein